MINASACRASGRVIVFGGWDDISEPERVAWTMRHFANPRVAFVHTAVSVIDEGGKLVEGREGVGHRDCEFSMVGMLLGTDAPILGASCAYRVDVFRRFCARMSSCLSEA